MKTRKQIKKALKALDYWDIEKTRRILKNLLLSSKLKESILVTDSTVDINIKKSPLIRGVQRTKALAFNRSTGKAEWYNNLLSDGSSLYFKTPNCGIKELKDPIEIWVTNTEDEESYVCIRETKVAAPLPITQLLTLSISHISKADNDKLGSNAGEEYVSAAGEGGYFLYCPLDLDEMIQSLKNKGFSLSFIALYDFAFRDTCYAMLRLDVDGNIVVGLETNEW
jgi:hypothetical protein